MDVSEIAAPAITTAATGVSVVWVAKVMINRWLSKQERDSELLRKLDKDLAVIAHRIGELEKDLNGLGNSMRKNFTAKASGPLGE